MARFSPRTLGIFSALFSVLVWSGWMVLSTISVRGSLTAADITALRFGVSGLAFLPYALRKGLKVGPWGIWGGILLSVLMGAVFNFIAVTGMRFAPASHGSLIHTSVLVLATLGGMVFLKEKLSRLQLLGVGLSVAGIACLIQAGGATSHAQQGLGHALFLLCGAMWAGYILLARAWKADPWQIAAAVCCFSAILYMPVYFLFLPKQIGWHNWGETVFQGVYQGLINSVAALYCYNRAVKLLGASASSAFLPLVPVLATLVAIPALGELPIALEWAGLLLACIGVLLSTGIAKSWLNRQVAL